MNTPYSVTSNIAEIDLGLTFKLCTPSQLSRSAAAMAAAATAAAGAAAGAPSACQVGMSSTASIFAALLVSRLHEAFLVLFPF